FGGTGVRETQGPLPLFRGPRPAGWRTLLWAGAGLLRFPLWLFQGTRAIARELALFWWGGIRGAGGRVFRRPLAAFDRGYQAFADTYHRALVWSLDRRALVLGLSAVALAFTLLGALRLDRDLLPQVDQGSFEVGLELAEGTTLERTDEV